MINRTFPSTRLRRNRYDDATRRLVAEQKLSVDDLIWPIFIREGGGEPVEIAAMPGVFRTGLDGLAKHVEEAARLRAGIGPGLLRVSVGIEAHADLIADLSAGLERAAKVQPAPHLRRHAS